MSKPSKQKDEHVGKEGLADAILGYLAEHPRASDTLKGIAEWWIMRQQVRVEVSKLREVLSELMQRGLLEKISEGESTRYRLKAMAGEKYFIDGQSLNAAARDQGQAGD